MNKMNDAIKENDMKNSENTSHKEISAETYRRIIDRLLASLDEILENHEKQAKLAEDCGLDTSYIAVQTAPYIEMYARIKHDLQEAQLEADQAGEIEA